MRTRLNRSCKMGQSHVIQEENTDENDENNAENGKDENIIEPKEEPSGKPRFKPSALAKKPLPTKSATPKLQQTRRKTNSKNRKKTAQKIAEIFNSSNELSDNEILEQPGSSKQKPIIEAQTKVEEKVVSPSESHLQSSKDIMDDSVIEVGNVTNTLKAGPSGLNKTKSSNNVTIIDLDEIDDKPPECIILSDSEEVVDADTQRAISNSLIDLTNVPDIDPGPGPSGLNTKRRAPKRKSNGTVINVEDHISPVPNFHVQKIPLGSAVGRLASDSTDHRSQSEILNDIMDIAEKYEQQDRSRAPYRFIPSAELTTPKLNQPKVNLNFVRANHGSKESPHGITFSKPSLVPVRPKVKPAETQLDPATSANESSDQSNGWSCPICMESLSECKSNNKPIWITPCGHLFCKPCLQASLKHAKNVCPSCRKKITWAKTHQVFM